MSRKYNKTFLSEKELQEEIDHLWDDDDIIISDEDVSELEDNVIEHNDTALTGEDDTEIERFCGETEQVGDETETFASVLH